MVVAPGEDPQRFDGWLQLLHILGDVITPPLASGLALSAVAGEPGVHLPLDGGADQGDADEHE